MACQSTGAAEWRANIYSTRAAKTWELNLYTHLTAMLACRRERVGPAMCAWCAEGLFKAHVSSKA
eukprot:147374-Pelagomonas_calceolata.AAC.1